MGVSSEDAPGTSVQNVTQEPAAVSSSPSRKRGEVISSRIRGWSRQGSQRSGRLTCGRARHLQCLGPPQQVVDHGLGGDLKLRESRVHITTLEVRPEGRDRNVDGRSNWSELKLYRCFAELLDAASARSTAVTHKSSRLAVPLRINPVERVLEHRSGPVVIFRRDEDEAVRTGDFGGPFLDHFIIVRRATRHGRRHGLVEEGHWKVPEIEQPGVDATAILEPLKN